MSLEYYAVHIAPRGGKIDLIVDEINAARTAAFEQRAAFAHTKGAIGTYGNDSVVSGLLFPYTTERDEHGRRQATLPEGWAVVEHHDEYVVAQPKAKDRTKEARAKVKALRAELAAQPKLTGSWEFTNRIDGSQALIASDGRGFCLASCFYERVGDTTFVFTPWTTKQQETGDLADDDKVKTAFHPEGCQRVGLSVYYAAKEQEVAA